MDGQAFLPPVPWAAGIHPPLRSAPGVFSSLFHILGFASVCVCTVASFPAGDMTLLPSTAPGSCHLSLLATHPPGPVESVAWILAGAICLETGRCPLTTQQGGQPGSPAQSIAEVLPVWSVPGRLTDGSSHSLCFPAAGPAVSEEGSGQCSPVPLEPGWAWRVGRPVLGHWGPFR